MAAPIVQDCHKDTAEKAVQTPRGLTSHEIVGHAGGVFGLVQAPVGPVDTTPGCKKGGTEIHAPPQFMQPSCTVIEVAGKKVNLDSWERLENLYVPALQNRVMDLRSILREAGLDAPPCPGHKEGKISWILEVQHILAKTAGEVPVQPRPVSPNGKSYLSLSTKPGCLSSLNGGFRPGVTHVLQPAEFTQPSSNIVELGNKKIVLDSWQRLENLSDHALNNRVCELKEALHTLGQKYRPCLHHHDEKVKWILEVQDKLAQIAGLKMELAEPQERDRIRRLEGEGAISSLNGAWGD